MDEGWSEAGSVGRGFAQFRFFRYARDAE